jgi:phenylalanyl-tRNA synthetase alpha chain
MPGIAPLRGHLHPVTNIIHKAQDIFLSMGFEVVEGPEVETQEFNFDLLNIPRDHPARDMQDTFHLESDVLTKSGALRLADELVLRTHTSSVQLRSMLERKPPVRLVVPGRCYRYEATDASHETTFHQLECLVIDEEISIRHLIATIRGFLSALFDQELKVRVRPSYFPFVEPGLEIDMNCFLCEQKGCSACKRTGWLEIAGAGMVHPNVLKNMGVDSATHSGFAFGMGIDRVMMLYYGVSDIRLVYSADLRFLGQF